MLVTRRAFVLLLLAAFVLLNLFNGLAGFLTDWLWFKSLGFVSVMWTIIGTEWAVRAVVGVAFFLFIYINLMLTRGAVGQAIDRFEGTRFATLLTAGRVSWLFGAASLVLAAFGSLTAGLFWETVQKFLHGGAFGVADPLFGRDIGFYLFKLPFLNYVYQTGFGLLILTIIAVSAIYFISGAFEFDGLQITLHGRARFHLAVLLAMAFALKAWGYWLGQFSLLYSTRGVVFGAGYTDVHVNLMGYRVLMVVALFCTAIVLLATVVRSGRFLAAGIVLLVGTSFLLGSAYPGMYQQFVVDPNELAKETPYINQNIKSSRMAWGLDKVEERPFVVRDDLTYPQVLGEKGTIQNVRLWDWRPLQATYAQLQEMRLYYDFPNVDLDRYATPNGPRAVTLAARELNVDKVPAEARTWLNLHMKYTHGYGVVMSPVNEVTEEGMPNLWLRNIPPQAAGPAPAVTRPQIYFGELTKDYVIVGGKSQELDYPMGDQNAYTTYKARTGVPLDSPLTRAAFAVRFGTLNLLLARDITPDSQVLMYRNIVERAEKVAPFLRYDQDPYLVVNNGRLFWIQDAYVTTDLFPYSQPIGDWGNYVRNPVKVVTDAYTGAMSFYLWDAKEPLVAAYARIFPHLFKPRNQMPAGLVAHVRYPEDLFRLQAQAYDTYHMKDASVFYNKEDLWAAPRETVNGEETEVQPYYVVMRLPNGQSPEFVLMQSFTPAKKGNMIAWMAVHSDPDDYGRLVAFKFPKQSLTFGPAQVEARIDQDSEISRQLTLWNQKGSRVIRGNLLVIPVRSSVLYVEPIYLQAEQSQMPELKRVVVSFRDQVAMETSLDAALARVFGQAPPAPGIGPKAAGAPIATGTAGAMAQLAGEQLAEAQRRLAAGDWIGFGQEMDRLRATLEQLSPGASKPQEVKGKGK